MRNYRKLSAINQELLSATAQTMVALEEQYPGLPKRPAVPAGGKSAVARACSNRIIRIWQVQQL